MPDVERICEKQNEYQAFAGKENTFRKSGYEIIVAGKNFGCGSKTVEHPVMAMLGAGVKLVIADSFSRYSYRNAINLALPVLICPGIEHTLLIYDEFHFHRL